MEAGANPIVAGIDLGGTHFVVAVGGGDGAILAEEKQPTMAKDGPAAVLDRIGRTLEGLVGRSERPLSAIGFGVPGLIDFDTGETRFLPNLPTQWRGVPVAATLSRRFGCPVHLLNDARAAALGESMFGAGKGVGTMAMFTLGTGVGGGVVVDGRLRLGPLGAAGEIGHICVEPGGLTCGCGCRGCLETIASGPALAAAGARLAREGGAPALLRICGGDASCVSPEALGQAAKEGDAGAAGILERAGSMLGLAASAVVLTLHPELIVLGGGVSSLGDLLIAPMRRSLRVHVGMFPVDGIRIERTQLGERAGVCGGIAAALRGGVMGAKGRKAP
jgi:glucokinase